jgi:hypothetical protein
MVDGRMGKIGKSHLQQIQGMYNQLLYIYIIYIYIYIYYNILYTYTYSSLGTIRHFGGPHAGCLWGKLYSIWDQKTDPMLFSGIWYEGERNCGSFGRPNHSSPQVANGCRHSWDPKWIHPVVRINGGNLEIKLQLLEVANASSSNIG